MLGLLAAAGLGGAAQGCSASRRPAAAPVASPPAPPGSARPSPAGGSALEVLSAALSAPLLRPGSAGYPAAARLYNPRFDASALPAAIARCRSSADVAACVRYAAAGGSLRLRAGGHSYGGWSSGPGLVADVRPMSSVVVDTAAGTARIGAGARLIDVYGALAARGVALAAGSCPTVGLTGLALGGGVGVLTRACGLTCDALRGAEVVTADGRVRTVDARHDPDLFWALRGGGGGSFAAVTSLTMAVRPAPVVHTFVLTWPESAAAEVLAAWQRWTAGADRRLWSTCKVLARPATGQVRVLVAGTWIGPADALDAQLRPLLTAAGQAPASRSAATRSYAEAMLYEAACSHRTAASCTDRALSPPSRQPFSATSALLPAPLPADGTTAAVEGVRRGLQVPGMVEGGVSFDALGGAVADVRPADTAFVHRRALASVQYTATWAADRAGADPAPYDAFVRAQRAGLLRWTGTGAYVNYADPALPDHAAAYWGSNVARLRDVQRRYDPHGVLRSPPGVGA